MKKEKQIKAPSLPDIKKYVLNGNVELETLYGAGFIKKQIENYNLFRLSLLQFLTNNILLRMDIIVDGETYLFDDSENIYIYDNNIGDLYHPFYMCNEYSTELAEIINKYNSFMDNLVENNILIKEKHKTLTMENYIRIGGK